MTHYCAKLDTQNLLFLKNLSILKTIESGKFECLKLNRKLNLAVS